MSRTANSSEAGFTLAGLIVLLTIIMVFVAFTVPRQWSKIMQRERDAQTIYAMKQYARAIHNFRTKNNTLPVSLKQIIEARSPRLIRGNGELIDPLTGQVDWIAVPASAQQGQTTTTPPGTPPPPRIGTPFNQNQAALPQPAQGGPTGQGGEVIGPIIGVRPNKKGQSFLSLNGAESYEQWMYTVNDLQTEIDARRNALVTTK